MHRVPEQERWSAANVEIVIGVPWRSSEVGGEIDRGKLPAVLKVSEEMPKEEKEVVKEEAVPRGFKITKKDLVTHGYSVGCPRCKVVLKGMGRQGHSNACRKRFEKVLAEEEKAKKATDRADDFLADALEKQ